ncbi:Hypothetical predicted protein [Paramuricea clavata]|uniref:Uncharacterized protein n=1 Tax=Paramuricea clavata TaxID=317549 RepID=A0A7D9LN50_PARCT|nr:Hypothetical predicted protein [Paramuricea clavata]
MHDEDCRFGLRVKNKRGDKWNAYGDGYLIKTGDKDNFQLVVEAVNTSAYQMKDGELQVRVNLNDLQSKEISPNWTGIGRLGKLLVYQPKNSALPPA